MKELNILKIVNFGLYCEHGLFFIDQFVVKVVSLNSVKQYVATFFVLHLTFEITK